MGLWGYFERLKPVDCTQYGTLPLTFKDQTSTPSAEPSRGQRRHPAGPMGREGRVEFGSDSGFGQLISSLWTSVSLFLKWEDKGKGRGGI